MEENIFKNFENGDTYLLGFVGTLLLMYLLPQISSIGLIGFLGFYDSDVLKQIMDASEVVSSLVLKVSYVCQVVGYIVLSGLIIITFKKILLKDFVSFKNKVLKNLIIVIAGFLLMYLLTVGVNYLFDLLKIPTTSENQEMIVEAIYSEVFIFVAFAVVILAPFVEEFIFRKFLFGTIENKLKWNRWIAILLSTLIFSLIHISKELELAFQSFDNLIYLTSIFLYLPLSLVLSLAYSYSNNNIYVAIGIHMLNNLLSLLLIIL